MLARTPGLPPAPSIDAETPANRRAEARREILARMDALIAQVKREGASPGVAEAFDRLNADLKRLSAL